MRVKVAARHTCEPQNPEVEVGKTHHEPCLVGQPGGLRCNAKMWIWWKKKEFYVFN